MKKFCFILKGDEQFVHEKIERFMAGEKPVRGLWGNNLYGRGIHFTRNDNYINGFFLEENEDEEIHSSPIRTCFYGKIIKTDTHLYYKGIIIPEPIGFVFIVAAALGTILTAKYALSLLAIPAALIFELAFLNLIKIIIPN